MHYYNRKYGRDGHLFKERFKSEPVNDMAYFTVLLRYIHQNPVKAGIVEKVKDYEFSSWGEYDGTVEPVFQICDVNTVLNRITFKELNEWVNDPLDDDVYCKCWGQAPRSYFSAGVRPQSKVFELAAVAFFAMKGVVTTSVAIQSVASVKISHAYVLETTSQLECYGYTEN